MKIIIFVNVLTWEKLRLVRCELAVSKNKTFQSNRKFDVARPDHVLNLEVFEFGGKSQFLNNSCILAGCEPRILFRFSPSADHLARAEDQSCGSAKNEYML